MKAMMKNNRIVIREVTEISRTNGMTLFELLLKYKENYGHTDVPFEDNDN